MRFYLLPRNICLRKDRIELSKSKIMRYAKAFCCTSVRNGVIIIGAVDIILSAVALGFDVSRIYSSVVKNKTESTNDKPSYKETETIDVAAVVGIVAQILTIIIAGILIAVAIVHKAKFCKVLLIWLIFTLAWLIIITVALFVRVIVYRTSYVDVLITLVFCCYEAFCFWLVLSYYKLLEDLGDHHDVGYDAFANESDFSALERPS